MPTFAEIDNEFFVPGETLKASTVQQINDNVLAATYTPEFFGPTDFQNGDIIPIPTSVNDPSYTYSREELQYIPWFHTTDPAHQIRLVTIGSKVDPLSGLVTINTNRLPPGGPFVELHDGLLRILIIATRQAQNPEIIDGDDNPPLDGGGTIPGEGGDTLLGAAPALEVDLAPGTDGDFTVAHGLGATPALALIVMTSGGNMWFRGARYDGTNLYLSASGNVTGKALLFTTAPSAEVDLAPGAAGDFMVSHSLGATPALVLIQNTSGGNIWSQPAIADNSHIYCTASGDITGKAELWLGLLGIGSPSIKRLTIGLSATADGNFEVLHGIGATPSAVFIHMNSPGFPAFWFQSTRYDDAKIYLVSPGGTIGAPITGFAEILYTQ